MAEGWWQRRKTGEEQGRLAGGGFGRAACLRSSAPAETVELPQNTTPMGSGTRQPPGQ
jgi:hypothetical protein